MNEVLTPFLRSSFGWDSRRLFLAKRFIRPCGR